MASHAKVEARRRTAPAGASVRAAFAGEGANSIVSVAEYKDWATFAEARTRRAADKEYQKWYGDLVASDSSELISISLFEEVTP